MKMFPTPKDQKTMNELFTGMQEIIQTILTGEKEQLHKALRRLPQGPPDEADVIFWQGISEEGKKRILMNSLNSYLTLLEKRVRELDPPVPGVDF